jgi:hypothetical protein
MDGKWKMENGKEHGVATLALFHLPSSIFHFPSSIRARQRAVAR